MNKSVIDRALLFYDINDENYKNKCYKCLDSLNKNIKTLKKFYNIRNKIYNNKNRKIEKLWETKSKDKMFDKKVHPYITNLLLLSGYNIHKKNMKKFNLDIEQIKIHKLRVKECLTKDIIIRNYDGIRISQMLWGTYFINIKLIEVGILQYEKYENCIKIHIPSCGKLNINKVKQSLDNSKKYIRRYFKLKDYNYYCDSWLLSKQIHEIIDKNSNIYKFYNLFNVEEGESCIDDILNFVYQKNFFADYNKLPENTSLQIKIKKLLLNGTDIRKGKGILKKI